MTLVEFLLARVVEDEETARAISGGTVEGERGNWLPVATGDEWAASRSDCEVEVLVALRSGLPTPPDPRSGLWGAVVGWSDIDASYYDGDPQVWLDRDIMPVAQHMARHDPARVLAECQARRAIIEEFEESSGMDYPLNIAYDQGLERALTCLVQPFKGHPDFDAGWSSA